MDHGKIKSHKIYCNLNMNYISIADNEIKFIPSNISI